MVTLISENGSIAAKVKTISFKYDVNFWNFMLCIYGFKELHEVASINHVAERGEEGPF